jgi:hypothetical protein
MSLFVPGNDDKGRPYGDMEADVCAVFARWAQEENERDIALAAREQAHINKTCGREATLLDHGQLALQISGRAYSHWEHREGKGFFGDKSNRRDFAKRHPECVVKGIPKNPSIRVPDTTGITTSKTSKPRHGGRWAL